MGKVASLISGEWILTRLKRPNGGAVILARALWTAAVLYVIALALHELVDPRSVLMRFDSDALRVRLVDTSKWYAAIFASVYTALYARFASQWSYLANLYNQIMAAQVSVPKDDNEARDVLAAWKAGFIEDAAELHLANKPVFASVIRAWGNHRGVKKAFIDDSPGGEKRFRELMTESANWFDVHDAKWRGQSSTTNA